MNFESIFHSTSFSLTQILSIAVGFRTLAE